MRDSGKGREVVSDGMRMSFEKIFWSGTALGTEEAGIGSWGACPPNASRWGSGVLLPPFDCTRLQPFHWCNRLACLTLQKISPGSSTGALTLALLFLSVICEIRVALHAALELRPDTANAPLP